MSSALPERSPQLETTAAALEAVYNWNYEPEIDTIRTLYANALERQWIAVRDLDWDRGVDREAFSRTFSLAGIPVQETDFWKGLDADVRWEISRRTAAFMLSNFLHGEQGALMVAAQLVNAVPHMDGKFYAATQTLDEARHTGFGIKYLSAVRSGLAPATIAELEDFAFEAARLLVDSRTGSSLRQSVFEIWKQAGLDPKEVLTSLLAERDKIDAAAGGVAGPVRGFVIPTLRSIGLFSERIEGHFRDMFAANFGEERAASFDLSRQLPEDLDAWVESDRGSI